MFTPRSAQQPSRVARVAAREPDHDPAPRRVLRRARCEYVGIGIDADQRHAARAAADLHELGSGAAADVGDHVALARRELGQQRAPPARSAREHDDERVVEPELRRGRDVVALVRVLTRAACARTPTPTRTGRGSAPTRGRTRASRAPSRRRRGQSGSRAWPGSPSRANAIQASRMRRESRCAAGEAPSVRRRIPSRSVPNTNGSSMPVAGAEPAADQRRPPREQITPHGHAELGEPVGRALRRVVEDAVALDRLPEPRRRAAPAPRARGTPRAPRRPRCSLPSWRASRRRTSASARRAAARIEQREQAPLVAVAAHERRHARDVAAVERLERGARQEVAVDARLPRHEPLPDPESASRRSAARAGSRARARIAQRLGVVGRRARARRGTAPRPARPAPRWRRGAARRSAGSRGGTGRARAGVASSVPTLMPPADSPKIVTFPGSPPNAAMLSRTHSSAAI